MRMFQLYHVLVLKTLNHMAPICACPNKTGETCDLSVIEWPLNTSILQAAVANRANAKWTQSILDPNLNVACTKVSFSGKWLMDWQSYRNGSIPTDANPRGTEWNNMVVLPCWTLIDVWIWRLLEKFDGFHLKIKDNFHSVCRLSFVGENLIRKCTAECWPSKWRSSRSHLNSWLLAALGLGPFFE